MLDLMEHPMASLEVNEEQIIALLKQLPPEQRERVLNRFSTLSAARPRTATRKPHPVFGGGKDDIQFMADDFDAPLEEFRDYSE